jgi:hypothetical protein
LLRAARGTKAVHLGLCSGGSTDEEAIMPNDKTKVGEPDRSRVSANQDYEVRQLAEKHGLSPTQIRELIARAGNDREKLDEAAKQLRAQRT